MVRTKDMTLNEQAQEIIRIAEESGVQSNFFFLTTFKRYQVQLNILTQLEKKMKEDGMVVTKEYVKGRKNVYSNPAVAEYNRTTDSANKTVSTLMRIIRNFNVGDGEEEEVDPLMRIINGGDDDDESDE
ncbi:hypothetical protein [Megamonas hypermegale]|uniref:hypothetical protein n=1 Tax=Megamonas hypermegale TaxID=158847 RepID=UPI0026F0F109|nr:hypothetical protein [Megamonas hypermegale]